MPEMRLAMTDCADRPTMIPLTPPTVSSGWMLIPKTCSAIIDPVSTSSHEARPLIGRIMSSNAVACATACVSQAHTWALRCNRNHGQTDGTVVQGHLWTDR
jgi:hypothetical protein